MLSIDGLVTGIDTTSIIESLLSIQQSQIDRFDLRKQEISNQQLAVGGIEARLLSFQASLTQLTRIRDNALQRKIVSSSNEDILTAAVSNSAVPGDYQVKVKSLAQSHQIVSNGFDAPESIVRNGELKIRVGAGTEVSIGIDDNSNTLESVAQSINDSNADVTASIIKVGSGSGNHKLLLAAKTTGASNDIQVTFVASGAGGTEPVFDLGNPVQAAADATIEIGSGAGAIEITDSDNQIDELFTGITLNLRQADVNQQVTLSVEPDTTAASDAITGFVDSYNDLITYINDQTAFDPATSTASVLFSNRTVNSIKDELSLSVTSLVPGLSNEINRLSAIGITINSQGLLNINSAKLQSALSGGEGNTGIDDFLKLFSTQGESTNQNVRFLLASDETVASKLTNGQLEQYEVNILSAAEKAFITSGTDVAANVTIDASNDDLLISVDKGTQAAIQLQQGTYTQQELADLLQSTINAASELSGRSVSVSVDANRLKITSDTYGRSSDLALGGGDAAATLGFVGDETDFGLDVVGEFIVDGVAESATGNGQVLSGRAESGEQPGKTEGLQVLVTLTQSQVAAYQSDPAQITVTRGIASRVNLSIRSLVDSVDGDLKRINDAFDDRIKSIDDSIERLNAQFEARQQSLIEQFARLETIVGDLQAAGGFLSTQLASLPKISQQF